MFKISKLEMERRKQGLTQKKLHEKSGVGTTTICKIERYGIENIPVTTLRKLSKALNITVSQLFFSDNN